MSNRLSRLLPALLALGFILGAGAALQAQITADDFNQLTWRWVGPVNFSGRIAEFAVPPGQTTTYYVLAASGGVWKTEDAGTHFEPIFDKYGNMSMGSLGIAASDPKVLYLGTGEPMHARSSSHGNGVWKSTDAGKTWTNVGLTKSYFINKVQVDPRNPDVVYVAAEGKLYDNAMDSERGLFKTVDGGKTWTNLGPVADRGVGDFVVDPRNFDVVIAQAYKLFRRSWTYIDRQPGNHLYKTVDGGKSWK
ncbi:MAG TPA: glycosyl hydrolase, partial [Acidobacteriota bacterium]|nr:glycosyl hydrolase [Acidobacteriota bacterium]